MLEADPSRAPLLRRKLLCTTIAGALSSTFFILDLNEAHMSASGRVGNACEHLLITDYAAPDEAIAARPVVALSARVHPGESNSSFMMRGSSFRSLRGWWSGRADGSDDTCPDFEQASSTSSLAQAKRRPLLYDRPL